jgi:hypothetical protein
MPFVQSSEGCFGVRVFFRLSSVVASVFQFLRVDDDDVFVVAWVGSLTPRSFEFEFWGIGASSTPCFE